MSEAGSHSRADSVDEQIAALLESLELDVNEAPRPAQEAGPSLRATPGAPRARRKRRPLKPSASQSTTRPRPAGKARSLSPPLVRARTRGPLFADQTPPELAFFVGAALIVGAGVGLLVGLFA